MSINVDVPPPLVLMQAAMEPQQRHGFCVSVRLSQGLAATTLRLLDPDAARTIGKRAGACAARGSSDGEMRASACA